MQTIELPSLADHVRTLPVEGAARDRQLYRLIDLHASAEAIASLRTASKRGNDDGALTRVLAAASAVLGPSADDSAAHDRLREAASSPEFLALLPRMIRQLRVVASSEPDSGACTVATALALWSWTMNHMSAIADSAPQAIDDLAEALCPLLAARCLALDIAQSTGNAGERELRRDLCHVQAASAAAAAAATCAELVFGYRRHQSWDSSACGACFGSEELDGLEAMIPGFASGGRTNIDVIEADGSHPAKEGPCVNFEGLDKFMRLRRRLDGCLTGARIAKDRAASTIEKTMTDKKGIA